MGEDLVAKAKEVFPTLAQRVYCINLIDRDDRMQEVSKRFAKVGLDTTVTFHRVHRHEKGGRYGCFDSHRQIVRTALEDGLERIMIFEDDCDFNDGWEQVVLDSKEFLDSGEYFDALLLGSRMHWVEEKTTKNIWRVKATNNHAYILSKSGMELYLEKNEMIEEKIQHITQDLALCNAWQFIYAHRNVEAITQDPDLGSDNQWLKRMPKEYSVWFQTRIVPRIDKYVLPIVRTDLYRGSFIGKNYCIFTRTETIDDGRVCLKPLPAFDFFAVFLFMTLAIPPRGYSGLCRDIFVPFWRNVWRGQIMD